MNEHNICRHMLTETMVEVRKHYTAEQIGSDTQEFDSMLTEFDKRFLWAMGVAG